MNFSVFNQIKVKKESLHFAYHFVVPYQHWPLIGHVTLILSAQLPKVSQSALVRAGSGQLIFEIKRQYLFFRPIYLCFTQACQKREAFKKKKIFHFGIFLINEQ